MNSDKRQSNSEKLVGELFQSIDKELKDLRIRDSLRKLQPLWELAEPKRWDELTEDERRVQTKEQAEAEQEYIREQRFLRVKRFLQSIIKAKSDDPNSKLFSTAEELLEFVVQYESKPSSVSSYEWNRLETVLLTRCEALLKAECKSKEEAAEIGQTTKPPGEDGKMQQTSNGVKADLPNEKTAETWYWKLYKTTLKVLVDAFLERFWPKPN